MQQEFINSIKDEAIRAYKEYKVLPSLTIAQAILESSWGKSGLAVNGKNFFGIKADKYWTGEKVMHLTSECIKGKWIRVTEPFRKYTDMQGSIDDHAIFLQKPRYKDVLTATNYKDACYNIWKAGYATDPNYPNKLIKIIEEYGLNKYDEVVENSYREESTTTEHWAQKETDELRKTIDIHEDNFDRKITRGEFISTLSRISKELNNRK